MFKIDAGIPVPPPTWQKYPWAAMAVGDSILIPVATVKPAGSMRYWRIKNPGWQFRTKREGAGYRIWRTA